MQVRIVMTLAIHGSTEILLEGWRLEPTCTQGSQVPRK